MLLTYLKSHYFNSRLQGMMQNTYRFSISNTSIDIGPATTPQE